MTECGHQSHPADNVAAEGGQEELREIHFPGDELGERQEKHCRGSGDDMVESADPYQVGQDQDDADSGGVCTGKQPDHYCDQPACDRAHQDRPKTSAEMMGADIREAPLCVRIEKSNLCKAEREQKRTDQV